MHTHTHLRLQKTISNLKDVHAKYRKQEHAREQSRGEKMMETERRLREGREELKKQTHTHAAQLEALTKKYVGVKAKVAQLKRDGEIKLQAKTAEVQQTTEKAALSVAVAKKKAADYKMQVKTLTSQHDKALSKARATIAELEATVAELTKKLEQSKKRSERHASGRKQLEADMRAVAAAHEEEKETLCKDFANERQALDKSRAMERRELKSATEVCVCV
jgi:chromosome segregation ATPase